jgi:hypothetical protein
VRSKQQTGRRARRKRKRIIVAGYSSEAETAEQLNVAIRTLRSWRQRGKGPPWVKVGRQVIYADQSRAACSKTRKFTRFDSRVRPHKRTGPC